ncbi:unnamed protein product [Chondrus crispus]|uniref:Uncharacterized protein n=1 Tax=Chondrus crispus TaxID=2769 RepID=R7QHR8_CHOCR|nr:unnamed protein product [Chondrus crispus]CDF38052.1 unnamed protein product [Chondrus crispus]|eukprot:XP_005717921.1 unnamed protein product [Chondrus crispus]
MLFPQHIFPRPAIYTLIFTIPPICLHRRNKLASDRSAPASWGAPWLVI